MAGAAWQLWLLSLCGYGLNSSHYNLNNIVFQKVKKDDRDRVWVRAGVGLGPKRASNRASWFAQIPNWNRTNWASNRPGLIPASQCIISWASHHYQNGSRLDALNLTWCQSQCSTCLVQQPHTLHIIYIIDPRVWISLATREGRVENIESHIRNSKPCIIICMAFGLFT